MKIHKWPVGALGVVEEIGGGEGGFHFLFLAFF